MDDELLDDEALHRAITLCYNRLHPMLGDQKEPALLP